MTSSASIRIRGDATQPLLSASFDRLTAPVILDRIYEHANELPGEPDSLPSPVHLERIRRAVRAGKPVQMVLPAFPAKSPNPQKTDGRAPDLAEVLGLEMLNGLCERIAEIYAPGAHVVICSDGRVFSDLVQVAETDVSSYRAGIRRVIETRKLRHLSLYDLDDEYRDLSYVGMRFELLCGFGESVAKIRERSLDSVADRRMVDGIHRFLFEDECVLRPEESRNRVRQRTRARAYETVQRSNAWSRLVEAKFPDAVRLSIHPQLPGASKIGVRLVPSDDCWRTPWHSVALWDGVRYRLVTTAEARALGAERCVTSDGYAYYSTVTAS